MSINNKPDPIDPFSSLQSDNTHIPFTPHKTKREIEYFSPALIALNREVEYHAPLRLQLASSPATEWAERLAMVAAYCNVALDGFYTKNKLDEVALILADRLYNLRSEKIYLPD